jgi:type VI secretion system protein ImpL
MQSKTLLIGLALVGALFVGFVFWVYFTSSGGLSLGVALLACLLPLLIVGAVWGFHRITARRSATKLEQALADDGARERRAASDVRGAEIDRLRSEFERAIKALKTSKLAHGSRGGSEALYRLPWYAIIGPPASGKTTVLRNSGLKFPYLPGTGDRLKGIGGTRNCDWWLTNQAILLDTAGRWSIEESERDEWLAFLELLKKHRGERPLNGIIAAISIAGDDATSINAASQDDLKEIALRMRERLDEITGRLGVALPVYLLFTKCDLIHGFIESFGDLSGERRKQIWGFTAPVLQSARRDPGVYFAQQFDLLREELEQRALVRMADEVDPNRIPLIYEFPAQFGALKEKLSFFVDELFDASAYRETPLLRGAYFTSGTQEGSPADLLFEDMADALNLRPEVYESRGEEKKSYFLHDMLMHVVFEDRALASASALELTRQHWKRRLSTGGLFASALAGMVLSIESCQHNLGALRHTRASLAASEKTRKTSDPSAVALALPITELSALQEDLARHEEGARGWLDLGLSESGRITPTLERYYQDTFTQSVLRPLLEQNQAVLLARTKDLQVSAGTRRAPSLDEDLRSELRDALMLHLLLTNPHESCTPKPLERRAFILERLLALWEGAEPAASGVESARRQLLDRYVALTEQPLSTVTVERDERSVLEARRALLEDDRIERLLARVIAHYEATPQTLQTLVGSNVALQAGGSVGGAFNAEAWAQISRGVGVDDFRENDAEWVLGCGNAHDDSADAERDRQAFQQAYLKRYAASWQTFLAGLAGRSPSNAAEAETMLGELLNRSGVLSALFANVRDNTSLLRAHEPPSAARAELLQNAKTALDVGATLTTGGLNKQLKQGQKALEASQKGNPLAAKSGWGEAEPAAAAFVEPLHAQFAEYANLDQPVSSGGGSALDRYRHLLEPVLVALQAYRQDESKVDALASAAQGALENTDLLLRDRGGAWTGELRQVLEPVLSGVLDLVRHGQSSQVARAYCDAVYGPFQRELAGRFPISPDSADPASLAAFVRFFEPSGGSLWAFQRTYLTGSVSSEGGRYRFTGARANSVLHSDLLRFLRRAAQITQAFFPDGGSAPHMPFRVRVRGAPGYSLTTFRTGSRAVQYDSGEESWVAAEWPGDQPESGVALSVTPYQGQSPRPLAFDNPWGVFMILQPRAGAQVFERSPKLLSAGWRPKGGQNFVKVDFASDDPRSPLLAAPFSATKALFPLQAPARISQLGAACSTGDR